MLFDISHPQYEENVIIDELFEMNTFILIAIHTDNTYINHILLPNTSFERQNLIMNISSLFQMDTI